MVAFDHRNDRGIRPFLCLDGFEASLIFLEGPRRVLDPRAGGVGGGGEGGSLRPHRWNHPLVLGGRQVQCLLVCYRTGLFHPFLNVLEGYQHHFGLDVGGEAIPDGGKIP